MKSKEKERKNQDIRNKGQIGRNKATSRVHGNRKGNLG